MKYVLDTNSLLKAPNIVSERDDIIVLSVILGEIENLELKRDNKTLMYEIRNAKRALNKAIQENKQIFDINVFENWDSIETSNESKQYDLNYADNIILFYAKNNNCGIITNDILLQLKAKELGIPCLDSNTALESKSDRYTGYKVVEMTMDEINNLYLDLYDNQWGLVHNQYLIIKDSETKQEVTAFVWKDCDLGGHLESINYGNDSKNLWQCSNSYSNFVARDIYQTLSMHSISNNQITMITGKAGTGKSMIGINMALKHIESGSNKFDKIVFFFNPAPAKDAIELGLYKGTKDEKSLQSSLGGMLKSRLGEKVLMDLMESGKIELLPFVDLRGYSTNDKENVIIYISEAQNLTTELLKLGLQRAGERTKIIIDGDVDAQLDKDIYKYDNGMLKASEIFRGSKLFGQVELVNIYRSEVAKLADLM